MNIKKIFAEYLVNITFIRNAILDRADLSAFKEKPPKRIMIKNFSGLFLILFSYVIGWPVVILLGVISISLEEPLIVIIGGPIAYGISHLVFLAGMYLAGAHYTMIFLRWATRVAMEKLLGHNEISSAVNKINNAGNKQI